MAQSRGRPPVESNRVREYLLEHPEATNRDVRDDLVVSIRLITRVRAKMVEEGLLPPAWGDHFAAERARRRANPIPEVEEAAKDTPFETASTADLERAIDANAKQSNTTDYFAGIEDDEEIDFGKLRRILWRVANRDKDPRIRTQAIWTLTRMQQDVSDRPLGPGIPRTRQSILDRLLLLFEGVGADVVVEAMQMYLEKRKGVPCERELSAEPNESLSSLVGVPVPSGSTPNVQSNAEPAGPVDPGHTSTTA